MKTTSLVLCGVLMALATACGSAPEASSSDDGQGQPLESSQALAAKKASPASSGTPTSEELYTLPNGQCDVSFVDTCEGVSARWSGNPLVYAYAQRCKMRNGHWSGAVEWSGACYTDMANINGSLRCQ